MSNDDDDNHITPAAAAAAASTNIIIINVILSTAGGGKIGNVMPGPLPPADNANDDGISYIENNSANKMPTKWCSQ